MKIAQEIRAGNVIMQNGAPWVVLMVAVIRFLASAQAPLSTPGKHP